MRRLVPYELYTRKDVQQIFDPHANFTSGAGSWGTRGIVSIPGDNEDYVFFVTFGRSQAHHVFDESVSAAGVLRWQSEPNQRLHHPRIRSFIEHDHKTSHIYLLLRTDRDGRYTYLGRLAYLRHDSERERPVYFEWQILDWNPPRAVREMLELPTATMQGLGELHAGSAPSESPLAWSNRDGQPTSEFRKLGLDYLIEPESIPDLGNKGMRLVLQQQRNRATDAATVEWTSRKLGRHVGYDICHTFADFGKMYFAVKTTRGGNATPFRMSIEQLNFAQAHSERYRIFRLYSFEDSTNSAHYFTISGKNGLLSNWEQTTVSSIVLSVV